MFRSWGFILALAVGLAAASCGDSNAVTSTADSTAPTTQMEAGSSTTVEPAPVAFAPSSSAGRTWSLSDLVLRGDGLGELRFGDASAEVDDALRAALGEPTIVNDFEFAEYEVRDGVQIYAADPDEEVTELWDRPGGREECWQMLCVVFGRSVEGDETFTGWMMDAVTVGYRDWDQPVPAPDPALTTEDGLGVGSMVAQLQLAHPDLVLSCGEGCVATFQLWPNVIWDGGAAGGSLNAPLAHIGRDDEGSPFERAVTDFSPELQIVMLNAGDAPELNCC